MTAAATRKPFRAGDVVRIPSIGESWVLACDEHNGSVTCCGWPESIIEAELCELEEAADDAKRLQMLRDVAKSGHGSPRSSRARDQLHRALLARFSVGDGVVYQAHKGAQREDGEVTSKNDLVVFVRFRGDTGSKACDPATLEPTLGEVAT